MENTQYPSKTWPPQHGLTSLWISSRFSVQTNSNLWAAWALEALQSLEVSPLAITVLDWFLLQHVHINLGFLVHFHNGKRLFWALKILKETNVACVHFHDYRLIYLIWKHMVNSCKLHICGGGGIDINIMSNDGVTLKILWPFWLRASSSSNKGHRSASGLCASRCEKRRRQAFRCMSSGNSGSWRITLDY